MIEKQQIIAHLTNLINSKIEGVYALQNSINESRLNETKSSAGDKYKTGSVMLQ